VRETREPFEVLGNRAATSMLDGTISSGGVSGPGQSRGVYSALRELTRSTRIERSRLSPDGN